LDKHIDTGKPGQLWVLPYNLEGVECRRIDSLATCNVDATDYLLDKVKGGVGQSSNDVMVESESSAESWYADLINKLKR